MQFMAPIPPRFKELAEALKNPNHPGWRIGSAEGGWVTPSAEEWGRPTPPGAPPAAPGTASK